MKMFDIYFEEGKRCRRDGNLKSARKLFLSALKEATNDDDRAMVYYHLGKLYDMIKNYETSIISYNYALEKSLKYEYAYSLSNAFFKIGKTNKAMMVLKKMESDFPKEICNYDYISLKQRVSKELNRTNCFNDNIVDDILKNVSKSLENKEKLKSFS